MERRPIQTNELRRGIAARVALLARREGPDVSDAGLFEYGSRHSSGASHPIRRTLTAFGISSTCMRFPSTVTWGLYRYW